METIREVFGNDRRIPLSRRQALAAAASGVALSALGLASASRPAAAQPATVGAAMVDRANGWLGLLTAEQHAAAVMELGGRTWRNWNYMLGSSFAPGLALEHMTAEQKDAALDLLATALSDGGLTTAMNIMLQQDILRDEWGKGSPDRNRERFSLMIFGTPSAAEPWGWRWEGHHLTITFTLMGDQVVAHTPKAFSSEPNTVPSGPYEGLVVLPENESLGRALFADLSPAHRRDALLQEASFGNVQTMAGREDRITARQGVALGDLPQGQADIVRRLIDVYTHDHLTGDLAGPQQARLAENDLPAVRFGWAGADLDGNSIYYRIHGDTFLIEFATLRNQPLHHHTIVHDLERNLGRHVI